MRIVQVFTTGGTIDKRYGAGAGIRDTEMGLPVAGQIFRQVVRGDSIRFRYTSLMKKDSLDMTDADRRVVAEACVASRARLILITHGTDTMIETAQAIHRTAAMHDRLVVLTGALRPYCDKHTDAEFNLALALGFLIQNNQYGVFIAMHGVHQWDACYKHPETGTFLSSRS